MAHSKQAKKRILQAETKNVANRAERSRMRTEIKKLETAVAEKNAASIPNLFKSAMAELHKAGRKGIISSGMASRKVSRLAALIKRTQAAPAAK